MKTRKNSLTRKLKKILVNKWKNSVNLDCERLATRGFESRHLHQKSIWCSFDGGDLVIDRQNSIFSSARQANDANIAKSLSANDDTFGALRLAA